MLGMKIITLSSHEIESTPLELSNILIIMPFIHPSKAKQTADILSIRANAAGILACVFDQDQEGFVSIANRIFKKTTAPYVAYVAEDAFPGMDWLQIGLQKLLDSEASLLAFNDGKWQGNLAAFGLVKREWAEKNYQGHLFYPHYKKHYADTELTLLAKSDRVFTYDSHSVLIEIDWDKSKKSVDADDRQLFLKRAQGQFDGRILDPILLDMFS
jgi:hypothetical protein